VLTEGSTRSNIKYNILSRRPTSPPPAPKAKNSIDIKDESEYSNLNINKITEIKVHKEITQKIIEAGFECYYVGGCVRDEIMGIIPDDYDITTNAKPEEIFEIFKDSHKVVYCGEAFKVVRVGDIEVATYRKDHYFGNSDKNCVIEYADSIEEDLSRRDLTVNAIAKCAKTGKIVDPFNGRSDIFNRLISFVGDPFERIKEDPNRMIRVARFAAKMNAIIEQDTLEAIRNSKHMCKFIAKERISTEILKAMKIKHASWFFTSLLDCGLLKEIFPTLDRCLYHDGGPHHKEDLFQHQMIAGDFMSTRCAVMKLAAYIHDIGKYHAYDKNERTFIGHEFIGEKVARKELKELRFSNEIVDRICSLIKLHMRNNYGSEKSVRKLIREFQEHGIDYRSHTRLKLSDRAGNLSKPNFKYSEIKAILLKYEELFTADQNSVFSIRDLAVNGKDIMEWFAMSPGKKVGEFLSCALEAVLDKKVNNEKEPLLRYLTANLFY